MRTRVVESMQELIIGLARPYILRELPGWGYLYRWAATLQGVLPSGDCG